MTLNPYQSFAFLYLARFSGVYLGNKSGVNFVAAAILPFIFIFPVMNAYWGFNFPVTSCMKSSSTIVKPASALASLSVSLQAPSPDFKSISQVFTIGPPFFSSTEKVKEEFTFFINGLASPLEMKT